MNSFAFLCRKKHGFQYLFAKSCIGGAVPYDVISFYYNCKYYDSVGYSVYSTTTSRNVLPDPTGSTYG